MHACISVMHINNNNKKELKVLGSIFSKLTLKIHFYILTNTLTKTCFFNITNYQTHFI